MSIIGRILGLTCRGAPDTTMVLPSVFSSQIRYKYWSERKAAPLVRRHGHNDFLQWSGLLPRVPSKMDKMVYGVKNYMPKKNWSEKNGLQGQNDYIDILGSDPTLNPALINYDVPFWLRGFRGNEYQTILRKRKFFGQGLSRANPDAYMNLRKRIGYLYRTLNRKRNILPYRQ